MKIELHDMSVHPHRIELVELPAVPRIGESIAWDQDNAGFTVRTVIHVVDRNTIQVRGW